MDVCRICLAKSYEKDIFQSQTGRNWDKRSLIEVFTFCLDIEVDKNTKISTMLCMKCYKKVLSFHKFKSLALKNDVYLKSLLEETSAETRDNIRDDINSEKQLSVNDEYQAASVKEVLKYNQYLKSLDMAHSYDSDDEPLSVTKQDKNRFVKNVTEVNVSSKHKSTEAASTLDARNVKHTCEQCGKMVKDLKAHLYRHLPQACRKQFKCHHCDKMFSSRSARFHHDRTQHQCAAMDTCKVCNKIVLVRRLRQHHRLMHDRASLPQECVQCGRRFLNKSSLDIHMTTHTKDRPHACSECDKKFSTKSVMLIHKRRVHDKEKSILCQFCPKRFFDEYHLNEHMRSHVKVKTFKCPDCGKFLSSRSTLKSHRETHKKERCYKCSLCHRDFVKKSYLISHMKTHSKKQYKCQYCDKWFVRSDNRKRHERTAHLEAPYLP